jgi:hypothetical protein
MGFLGILNGCPIYADLLTKSIRLLLDSVGFTLLRRLVVCSPKMLSLLRWDLYSHVLVRAKHQNYPLTFWLKPISLIWLFVK